MPHNIHVSDEELHTLVAALRAYQECGYGQLSNRPDHIHEIATDGGHCASLDDDGIDELVERINVREQPKTGDLYVIVNMAHPLGTMYVMGVDGENMAHHGLEAAAREWQFIHSYHPQHTVKTARVFKLAPVSLDAVQAALDSVPDDEED